MAYFQNDVWTGTIALRVQDPVNPKKQDPYTLPSGPIIQINFPGIAPAPSVTISSATALPSPFTGNEVVVTGGTLTDVTFTVITSKTAIVKADTRAQTVDIIVTGTDGSVRTFQIPGGVTILTRSNP